MDDRSLSQPIIVRRRRGGGRKRQRNFILSGPRLSRISHASDPRAAFLSIEFEEFASFDESGLRAEKRIKDHIVALGN